MSIEDTISNLKMIQLIAEETIPEQEKVVLDTFEMAIEALEKCKALKEFCEGSSAPIVVTHNQDPYFADGEIKYRLSKAKVKPASDFIIEE